MTNTTPAKKTAPTKKSAPAKKTAAAKAQPAKTASPAKKTAAAKKAAPLKHALKAAAAEIAPAVVEPDMTTVPDEQPPTLGTEAAPAAPAQKEPAQNEPTQNEPAHDEPAQNEPAQAEPTARPQDKPAQDEPAHDEPAQAAPLTNATTDLAKRTGAALADSPARTEAWARLIADPSHSPELLALGAVQTFGPQAQEWAARMREAYPNASPDALARLASQQFVRFGTVSSAFAAVAGSYAPLTLFGAAAIAHAELALHVAAAYGVDPADPARAVDLLVLTRVHPSREDAEAALAAARDHSYEGSGVTDAAWRLGRMVAVQAGGWTVLRAVNRFVPGSSLLAAVLTSRAAARTIAARANLFYRTTSAR